MDIATPRAAVVVLAAGSGSRVGAGVNKVLLSLRGTPVVGWSVRTVLDVPDVDPVVLVCRPEDRTSLEEAVGPLLGEREVLVVDGGASRHQSERHALQVLRPRIEAGEVDVVAVHDAARPLATAALFTRVLTTARDCGGAVPTVELPGLASRNPQVALPGGVVGVQTPQAFRAEALLAAYDAAATDGFEGTDTAACVAAYAGGTVRIRPVPAGPANLKVTWPEDVAVAERLLAGGESGEDAHVLG